MRAVTSRGYRQRPGDSGLFSEVDAIPESLPHLEQLRPVRNLGALFEECHNYIFANEGLLKDQVFIEIVKLLATKLYDEQHAGDGRLEFGVTRTEYRNLLAHADSTFSARLGRLFSGVRRKYPTQFSEAHLRLKPLTAAYVVARIQQISLGATPADVKGEAFQTFVNRHLRGDRGEFFTPPPIVKLAVRMAAPQPDEMVIDPACGTGGFLLEAIRYLAERHTDLNKPLYVQGLLRGIEFNPDVALSAIVRLGFEGGAGDEILCANALSENKALDGSFDVVLTNPPFGSRGKIEDHALLAGYHLARRWRRSPDGLWHETDAILPGQSPEVLFIERCLSLLRPGGRLAIVLPDGLLQNATSSHIRAWVRKQAAFAGVVSIPQQAFVPYGTGIKTSLVLLRKAPASLRQVFMAKMVKIGYDVKGQPTYKRDCNGKPTVAPSGAAVVDDDVDEIAAAFARSPQGTVLGTRPAIYWAAVDRVQDRLDAEYYQPDDSLLLERLREIGSKPLSEVADILTDGADFRLESDREIRYIAISDVDARTMQVVSEQAMKAHEAPSRATYELKEGDIITAVSGASTGTSRHSTALVTQDESGAICSNGFAVLRNLRGIDPFYLLGYMRTPYYLRQVRRLMTGHAIPSISREDLSRVLIAIPPPKEQARVASLIASIQAMRKDALRKALNVVETIETMIGQV